MLCYWKDKSKDWCKWCCWFAHYSLVWSPLQTAGSCLVEGPLSCLTTQVWSLLTESLKTHQLHESFFMEERSSPQVIPQTAEDHQALECLQSCSLWFQTLFIVISTCQTLNLDSFLSPFDLHWFDIQSALEHLQVNQWNWSFIDMGWMMEFSSSWQHSLSL